MFIKYIQHIYRIFSVVMLIQLLTVNAQSQSDLDSDPEQGLGNKSTARNIIHGTVYLPSGQRLNRRVTVRITGLTGGNLFTQTDDIGAFIFRRLSPGTYYVTVDAGKEFETATETVSVIAPHSRRQQEQTYFIQIQLQPKQTNIGKAGVINAELAAVPKPALELYKKALTAANEGKSKKAVKYLDEALLIYPEFMLAHNEIGIQYMRLKDFDKAAAALTLAIKLVPTAFPPRLNYGILMVQDNKFAEAENILRKLVEEKGDSAVAHLYLGRALIGLFNYDEAENEMKAAIKLGGDDMIIAHRYLGAIYIEKQDNERAIEELETFLRLMPKTKDAAQIQNIIKQLRKK